MKLTKGAIIAVAVAIGLSLVMSYVFIGMVVPTVLNSQIETTATAYTNATANLNHSNNATFVGNSSGAYFTKTLNAPVKSGSETIGNSSYDANGTCNLVKNTNYTIDYTTGVVNFTNVWSIAPCGSIARDGYQVTYSINYSGNYDARGNWTSYSTANSVVGITPLFVAILLLVVIFAGVIAFMKAVGLA